jgi:hypothetical protein
MNATEKYKKLVEDYFGSGTATFDIALPRNNVTGALARTDQYDAFREGFHARLSRLAACYESGNPYRKSIIEAVNNIAQPKNWEGAYAELAAIDFFNSDADWLSEPIELSRTVPATNTLAASKGMKNVNFDGYYSEFEVSFDVKVLQDKIGSMLEKLATRVKASISEPNLAIQPEFAIDMDFRAFDGKHQQLAKELALGLQGSNESGSVKSTIISGLTYRYRRTAGSLTTISCYDPYEHARNHHQLLFQHAKKFSRISPSVIVFVAFPWFSESVLSGGLSPNEVFYRAFARRCFCQYANDQTPANKLLEEMDDTVTMGEVTRSLSGVIFLEDHTVMEGDSEEGRMKAFAYFNPNANHKLPRHYRQHLEALRVYIDELEADNY